MRPAFADRTTGGPLFFWNLDGSVGLGGANQREDVLFVQWCLYKCALWDGIDRVTPPEMKGKGLRQSFAKTQISGHCTGRADDPLVGSIKAFEALFMAKMDGRVDPVKQSAKYTFQGSKHPYAVILFNIMLAEVYPDLYPRIDLVHESAFVLRPTVKAAFGVK